MGFASALRAYDLKSDFLEFNYDGNRPLSILRESVGGRKMQRYGGHRINLVAGPHATDNSYIEVGYTSDTAALDAQDILAVFRCKMTWLYDHDIIDTVADATLTFSQIGFGEAGSAAPYSATPSKPCLRVLLGADTEYKLYSAVGNGSTASVTTSSGVLYGGASDLIELEWDPTLGRARVWINKRLVITYAGAALPVFSGTNVALWTMAAAAKASAGVDTYANFTGIGWVRCQVFKPLGVS